MATASLSAHDALVLQPLVRAMRTAAAEVEDERAADQLDEWAGRMGAQVQDALDWEGESG